MSTKAGHAKPLFAKAATLSAAVLLAVVGSSMTQDAAAQPAISIKMRFQFDRSAPAASTYARLRQAAWGACRREGLAVSQSQRVIGKCASDMVDDGVRRIASPELATLHAERTHKAMAVYADLGQPG